jgi:hypothetical protein
MLVAQLDEEHLIRLWAKHKNNLSSMDEVGGDK